MNSDKSRLEDELRALREKYQNLESQLSEKEKELERVRDEVIQQEKKKQELEVSFAFSF